MEAVSSPLPFLSSVVSVDELWRFFLGCWPVTPVHCGGAPRPAVLSRQDPQVESEGLDQGFLVLSQQRCLHQELPSSRRTTGQTRSGGNYFISTCFSILPASAVCALQRPPSWPACSAAWMWQLLRGQEAQVRSGQTRKGQALLFGHRKQSPACTTGGQERPCQGCKAFTEEGTKASAPVWGVLRSSLQAVIAEAVGGRGASSALGPARPS